MILMPKRAWALLVPIACAVIPHCLPAAEPGRARAYLTGTTVREFPSKCDVRVDMAGDREILFVTRSLTLHVPYDKVNDLEYGQHVGQRYVEAVLISPLFLMSKTRKHYVTVGYVDANGRQQVLVMQVNKGDVRCWPSWKAKPGAAWSIQTMKPERGVAEV
jgi:hypothetical protein